jgi:lysophospholipase L1-like esterase
MNYKRHIILFNVAFLVLLLLSTVLFEWKPGIAGKKIKPVEIVSEIKKDSQQKKDSIVKQAPEKVTVAVTKINEPKDYATYKGILSGSDSNACLVSFYQKLYELKQRKRKKIRIGYFGDSMIEGDFITQDLRDMLQSNFGGAGVGFVTISSPIAGFRETIYNGFSSDWKDVNFKSEDKQAAKLFLSGHSFFSAGSSTVTYRASFKPHLDLFENFSLLYGKPDNTSKATIVVNDKQYNLEDDGLLNLLELNHVNRKEVKLKITDAATPYYGAAFESDSGIVLDNFSFRGISGIELNYFNQQFLKEIQEKRPYDLVIFHYGTNLLFKPQLHEFEWYGDMMIPILNKIKASFQGASLLLISTADKGASYNGEWKTAIGVEPLVKTQYNIADKTGVGFFNLYKTMGGEGTIVKWVQGDTVLARKDYTHPNPQGAKKLANLIYQSIIKEYDEYEKAVRK